VLANTPPPRPGTPPPPVSYPSAGAGQMPGDPGQAPVGSVGPATPPNTPAATPLPIPVGGIAGLIPSGNPTVPPPRDPTPIQIPQPTSSPAGDIFAPPEYPQPRRPILQQLPSSPSPLEPLAGSSLRATLSPRTGPEWRP
jgi:diaphanous 1